MVSRWSIALTRKNLEDVLRHLKDVLRASHGRRLDNVLKNAVPTSISDQSRTSLRLKYDILTTSLQRFYVGWDLMGAITGQISGLTQLFFTFATALIFKTIDFC